MSSIYRQIEDAMNGIEDEVARLNAAEDLPPLMLTGRIEMDHSNHRAWFELTQPGTGTSSWVTADAPELAAPGETLCGAENLDDAFLLGMD